MNTTSKQIYAALELCENDIKLLVAEYYNTRFNVLKVEREKTDAINDFKITDTNRLKADINKLLNKCSNKLGANIEKVILVVPAYNFKRFPLRAKIIPENEYLSKKDIARAITNSLRSEVDSDVMVVNHMIVKYNINGISTRRMPEKERCDEVFVDIDLLCADKELLIDYVTIVEQCGLKVLDICLNTYAICKEASLFDDSVKQNTVILDINRNCTYLSLLSKGKLASTEIVYDGLNSILDQVKARYDIPDEDILKLIKYDVNYNSEYGEDIVYAFSKADNTSTISTNQLNDICKNALDNLVDKLITMCSPIFESGANLIITGEGQQMSALVERIENSVNVETRSYFPDTIGVRDSSLTALYGCLFAYKEKAMLNDLNVNCIDSVAYNSLIENKEFDTEGDTITTKIKNLFKQYIEREDD